MIDKKNHIRFFGSNLVWLGNVKSFALENEIFCLKNNFLCSISERQQKICMQTENRKCWK